MFTVITVVALYGLINSIYDCKGTCNSTFHLSQEQKFTQNEINHIKDLLKEKKFHFCCSGNGVMVDNINEDED